jgi:hypothetical protein
MMTDSLEMLLAHEDIAPIDDAFTLGVIKRLEARMHRLNRSRRLICLIGGAASSMGALFAVPLIAPGAPLADIAAFLTVSLQVAATIGCIAAISRNLRIA